MTTETKMDRGRKKVVESTVWENSNKCGGCKKMAKGKVLKNKTCSNLHDDYNRAPTSE